jgi:hypothetical protein
VEEVAGLILIQASFLVFDEGILNLGKIESRA